MKEMQAQINGMKKSVPEIAKERDSLLNRIGNIVDPDVPTSHDEDNDNVVVALYPKPVEEENAEGKALLPSLLGELTYTLQPQKSLRMMIYSGVLMAMNLLGVRMSLDMCILLEKRWRSSQSGSHQLCYRFSP